MGSARLVFSAFPASPRENLFGFGLSELGHSAQQFVQFPSLFRA
jgi:hypothetical protein